MEKEIIKKSQTLAEAIRKIYGFDNGNNRRKIKRYIEENNIDISHLRKKPLIHERVIKKCPVCDKPFEIMLNNRKEKTTCSHSCSNTYFRSGENNPNWGDEVRGKFSKKYRTICFRYHKKECVVCGETKIVAVHHYDENHNNNSIENLIPLCPTHHQYAHSKYKDEVIGKIEEFINKTNKQIKTSIMESDKDDKSRKQNPSKL